eukprot:GAHX01001792.1.p1 GENE.GAHX01001792.1~~GAHX01001792.1.p1  ORF type:complete len:163 (+),score=15.83 GAHX01001792.1:54-542(+)
MMIFAVLILFSEFTSGSSVATGHKIFKKKTRTIPSFMRPTENSLNKLPTINIKKCKSKRAKTKTLIISKVPTCFNSPGPDYYDENDIINIRVNNSFMNCPLKNDQLNQTIYGTIETSNKKRFKRNKTPITSRRNNNLDTSNPYINITTSPYSYPYKSRNRRR